METTIELKTLFYYHYNHTNDSVNNFAYEALSFGHYIGDQGTEQSEVVIYRPLYRESQSYMKRRRWCICSREIFFGTLKKDDVTISRFEQITDIEIINQLISIRNYMYFGTEKGENQNIQQIGQLLTHKKIIQQWR